MKSLWKFAAVMAVAALTSCGGGSDSPVLAASGDTTLAINPTTGAVIVQAVSGDSFTFPTGVTALGTTASTAVVLNGGTTPTFSIASGGSTATGDLQFGSCIFVVKNSTFPVGHPLANGQTVTVNPCNMSVATSGAVANGVAQSRSVALLLGAAASSGQSVSVAVNAGGQLTLNGASVGTVTLVPVSG